MLRVKRIKSFITSKLDEKRKKEERKNIQAKKGNQLKN